MDPFTQFTDFALNATYRPKSASVGSSQRQQRPRVRANHAPGRPRISSSEQSPFAGPQRASGMGQIQSTNVSGEISSVGASVATAGVSAAASTGLIAASAVPIAGAVIAAIATIAAALGLGEGCGNSCIAAAEQEQVYEAAADNFTAVVRAGMLPGTVAAEIDEELITLAQQAEAKLGTSQSTAGASNAATTITASMNAAKEYGSTITQPLNLSTVSQYFIPAGTSGWYAESLSLASQLTLQILQEYADSAPSTTASSTGAAIQTSTGSIGLSTTDLLIGGGLLLVMMMMM